MKKTIFLLAFLSIIFIACNPLKPNSSAEPSYFISSDSIPGADAMTMIAHYSDAPVDKSLPSINKMISLYNSDLFKIFKIKKITRIRLLIAAYLATDPDSTRRNMPTVLLQLKKGYHSNYYYYDIQKLGANRICPPPPGCIPTP